MSKLIRDLIEAGDQKYAKQIVKALVERACAGNLAAIKELMARTERPPTEPTEAGPQDRLRKTEPGDSQ
jgi:hypothetical protein